MDLHKSCLNHSLGVKIDPAPGGSLYIVLYRKTFFLSETNWPRPSIFGEDCSNYCPRVNICPAWGSLYFILSYIGNFKKSSSQKIFDLSFCTQVSDLGPMAPLFFVNLINLDNNGRI